MSGPVGFTEQGARRVARATRVVERAYKLPPPARGKFGAPFFAGTKCGLTGGSGVPAMSGLTPGKASGGIIYTMDGAALVQDHNFDDLDWFNNMTSAVAASKNVQVVWIDGNIFVSAEDC